MMKFFSSFQQMFLRREIHSGIFLNKIEFFGFAVKHTILYCKSDMRGWLQQQEHSKQVSYFLFK